MKSDSEVTPDVPTGAKTGQDCGRGRRFIDSSAAFMPTELELALLEDLAPLRHVEALVPAPTPADSRRRGPSAILQQF